MMTLRVVHFPWSEANYTNYSRRNQSGGGGKAYERDDGGCGTLRLCPKAKPKSCERPLRILCLRKGVSWFAFFFFDYGPAKNYFSHCLGICALPGDVPKRANTESYANKATLLYVYAWWYQSQSTVFKSRELDSVILFDYFDYFIAFRGETLTPPP